MKVKLLWSFVLLLLGFYSTAQYCTTGGPTRTIDSNVQQVDMTGDAATSISETGCSPAVTGVQDLTSQSISVTAGTNYALDVTFGTCGGNYDGVGEVWIDFNHDETFQLAESIGTSSGTPGSTPWDAPVSFIVNVPSTAINGDTRMRIMQRESGSLPLDPCASYSWGSVMDFTVNISGATAPPSCSLPTALIVDNVTDTNVDLSWTNTNASTVSLIEYGPSTGFVLGSGLTTTGMGNTATISGLNPTTEYVFYVTQDCSAQAEGTSTQAGPISATTLASPPINDACANAIMINDGDSLMGDTTDATNIEMLTACSGGDVGLTCDSAGDSTPNEGTINFGAGVWYVYSSGGQESISIESGGFDTELQVFSGVCGSLTCVAGDDDSSDNGSGSFVCFDAAVATDYYIYVDGHNTNTGVFNIDLNVTPFPDCLIPTDLTISNATASSVDLSWTENGTATIWNVEFLDITAGDVVTGTATNLAVSNPFTKTGLLSNNDYAFYVQADCGAMDGTSEWAGPFNFTTPCNIFNLPFTENFDTTSAGSTSNSNSPNCWSAIDGGSGWAYIIDSSFNSQSGDNAYRLNNQFDSSGDYMLISPSIAELTTAGIQVQFSVKGASGQELELGTMTNPADASTFSVVNTITLTSSSYEDITISVPTSTDSYFAVRHGLTDTYDNFYMDDFSFLSIPTCLNPSALNATSVTSSSASLEWTAGGSETIWDIELVDLTAGDMVTGTATAIGVSNPYIQTSLIPQNDYEFYVRSDCGNGDLSDWVGPYSFTTPCVAYTPDYLEDFTNYIPNCWGEATGELDSTLSGTSSDWTNDGFINSGTSGAAKNNMYSTAAGNWLISPSIDLGTGNDYQLEFNIAATDWNTTNAASFETNDSIKVVISTDNGATWTTANVLQEWTQGSEPSATGDAIVLDLSSYSGVVKIGYIAKASTSTSSDFDLFIDNFLVRTPPSCQEPSALSVTNIGPFAADLQWSAGASETLWNIELVDVTAGDMATGIATQIGVTNPYTAGMLTPENDYEFYVQADCGGDGVSSWTGPFAFTTTIACPAPTALNVTSITSSSANLEWNAEGSETVWNIELVDVSAGDTVTGTATATGVANPYNLVGLTSSNDYQFYVQADCDLNGTSTWTGPYSFSTSVDYCAGDAFFDPGGTAGNYDSNEDETFTICPDNIGDKVVINFSEFSFENSGSNCYDGLTIYDGDVATGTVIPSPNGTTDVWCWDRGDVSPSGSGDLLGVSIAATTASGCITIVLTSDSSQQRTGFIATASCESTVYMWDGMTWSNAPEGNITVNDNLYVSGTGTASLSTTVSTENVYIDPNASIEANNGDITVTGNLINNGTITGSGKVVMTTFDKEISGNGTLSNLSIGSGALITVNGPQSIVQQLDVDSGSILNTGDNITFISNASGTARISEFSPGTISGGVHIERYIPAGNRSFRFVGTSVTGSSVFDSWQESGVNNPGFGTHITGTTGTIGTVNATTGHDETATGNQSMFKWSNSSQDWVGVVNTKSETLNAGEFYRLFIRGDRGANLTTSSPTNTATTLRSSGNLYQSPFTVTPGTSDGEFFALANPYQSKVSLDAAATGTTADMYYWDPTAFPNGTYSAITINGLPTVGSSGTATNVLEPGQAVFFVDSSVGTDPAPSVSISQSNKVIGTGNNAVFNVNPLQQRLRLNIYHTSRFNNNLSESDGLYIDFDAAHNLNIDSNDAVKLNGGNINMSIAKGTGEQLSVERRTLPTTAESIQLNMANYLTTDYTIVATLDALPGLTAYLKDNYDGSLTHLIQGAATPVRFTVDMNDALSVNASRFEIVFELVTLSNEDIIFGEQVSVYPNPVKGDVLNISFGTGVEGDIEVILFNALGQQVIAETYNDISNGVISLDNLSKLESGLYIVHLNNGAHTTTKKIIVD